MLTLTGGHFTFPAPLRDPGQSVSPRTGLCVTILEEVLTRLAERWLSGRKQRFAKPS
jgi:hypothetical protein